VPETFPVIRCPEERKIYRTGTFTVTARMLEIKKGEEIPLNAGSLPRYRQESHKKSPGREIRVPASA
jgi:hypothetical protein